MNWEDLFQHKIYKSGNFTFDQTLYWVKRRKTFKSFLLIVRVVCKYQFIGIFCILYNRARLILFVFTVYHVYSFVNSTLAFTARYWHYLQKVLVCAKYFQVYILTAHWLKVLQSSTCSWRCIEAEFEGKFYTFEENVFLDCLDLRLQCSLLWTEEWWVEKFLVFFLFCFVLTFGRHLHKGIYRL